MYKLYVVELPKSDEYGIPVSKMPNCPKCGEDELGMIHPMYAICYACGTDFHKFVYCGVGENLFSYKVKE